MKKKYNNKSNKFSEWTTFRLKNEAKCYYHLIYEDECYGTKDLLAFSGILKELEKRGHEGHFKSYLIFS